MSSTDQLVELVKFAKNESEFYSNLYEKTKLTDCNIENIPIATSDEIFKYTSGDYTKMMTKTIDKTGWVSSSSETTGKAKVSISTYDEWEKQFEILGKKLYESSFLRDGDIIANLTCSGKLRLTFLAVTRTLDKSPAKVLELPIGSDESSEYIIDMCKKFNVNVIAALPLTLINLAYYINKNKITNLNIDRIFQGGELMYSSQMELLKKAFPDASFKSFLYGGSDAGIAGYADNSCGYNEHKVLKESCILEIVDPKSHQVIKEPNKKGMILITSLCRKLMPVIRYSIGDYACWIDPETESERRFSLLGRLNPNFYKLIDSKIYDYHVQSLFNALAVDLKILRLQIILTTKNEQDSIDVKISVWEKQFSDEEIAKKVKKEFYNVFIDYKQYVDDKLCSPVEVFVLEPEDIKGIYATAVKSRPIIDARVK